MNKYKITIQHDSGTVTLTVYGSNYQSAITQVCNAEKCPETAIKSVELDNEKIADKGKVIAWLEAFKNLEWRASEMPETNEFSSIMEYSLTDFVQENELPKTMSVEELIEYLKY